MAINRALYMETGTNQQAAEAMTPSSDNKMFSASYAPFAFSSGDVEVLPYGIETGAVVTPSETNDELIVSAATVVMADHAAASSTGRISVAADTALGVTRPASSNVRYVAVVVNSAATPVFATISGTDNATFSDTVGAAGGPPYVPVDQILVALIKLSSNTAAVVSSSEILQYAAPTSGPISNERWDYPGWKDPILNFVDSVAGKVTFNAAISPAHTGDKPKRVIVKGYSAIMTRLQNVSTYSPPGLSVSSSSTDTFDGTTAEVTQSVTDGSFELSKLRDGIRDEVISMKGKRVLFQYFEDELETTKYLWSQGICVPSTTFEGKKSATASVTIGAQSDTVAVTN